MKTLFYPFLCLFVLVSVSVSAQKKDKPRWTDYQQRQSMFPQSTYVVGFTSEKCSKTDDKDEIFKRLQAQARSQLVEGIYVTIKSITTGNIVVSNTTTNEEFRRTSVSLSKVNVTGLIDETYYDEKESVCYDITYAAKSDISKLYRNTIATNKSKIEQKMAVAKAASDKSIALKTYYECLTFFREIEEAQTLIVAFEGCKLDSPDLFYKAIDDYKTEINTAINTLQKSEHLTLDELAYVLAHAIKIQSDSLKKDISLVNFTYQDSKMASVFSKRFADVFEVKLVSEGLSVARSVKQEGLMLTGTYWQEGKTLKIIAILRDMNSGKAVASAEARISKTQLDSESIAYIPSNYSEVSKNENVFFSNDVVSQGGLYADITTNRGNDNPIFCKGDTMKLSVKVNRECYIRVVYYFADGSKVLFFDNYYIAPEMVNRLISIPVDFECISPFGVETLQLNAQTQKFQPLTIRRDNGIDLITNNINEIVSNTRAFKPIENKDAKAEKRLIINTIEK